MLATHNHQLIKPPCRKPLYSLIGVKITPGAYEFTVILWGASSIASTFDSMSAEQQRVDKRTHRGIE